MYQLIIQSLYWFAIIVATIEMYVDYKANKFMIDMLLRKYKYRVAIIVAIIIRSMIILYYA
jgi:hypothetical protein